MADIIQSAVDELADQGINKIVLLAHMQRIDVEQALAGTLENVDIIVAGGSNTLLADETDRFVPVTPQRIHTRCNTSPPTAIQCCWSTPTVITGISDGWSSGSTTWVAFVTASLDPHISGVYAMDMQEAQAFSGQPIPEVSRIARSLRSVLAARDGNVVGKTAVYVSGGLSEVRTQETNLGNLTADANLWLARQINPDVLISFKNGGGIRSGIGVVALPPGATDPSAVEYLPPAGNPGAGKSRGDISQFDIEGALRFNNGLVILPVTAAQLLGILEHAVGFDGVGSVTDGRFPQVAGMRFSFGPSAPVGRRVQSVAVLNGQGGVHDVVAEGAALIGDPDRQFKIVTLNFLANSGDDYPFQLPHPDRIDLAGAAAQFNAPG